MSVHLQCVCVCEGRVRCWNVFRFCLKPCPTGWSAAWGPRERTREKKMIIRWAHSHIPPSRSPLLGTPTRAQEQDNPPSYMPHDPASLRVPAGVRQFAAPSANAGGSAASSRPTPPRHHHTPPPATSTFSAMEAGRANSVRDLAAAFGAMSPASRAGGPSAGAGGPKPAAGERVRVIVRVRPQETPGPTAVELDGATVVVRRR